MSFGGKDNKQKKFKPKITYEKPAKQSSKVGSIALKTVKIAGKVFLIFMLVCIITCCIVGTTLTVYVMNRVDTEATIDLESLKLNYTSIVYGKDSSGNDVEAERLYRNGENRIWVGLDKIPRHTQLAFVCAEDKRFYEHDGVDFKRTFAAFANLFLDIYSTKQGGSTITQQLIKNVTGEDEVRIERKVEEIFRAINLEKKYSKDDILEAYMNVVHFAHGTNGIQAAANLYFGKDVSELSIAESASIVAITKSPVKNDPFNYPENNRKRQLYILDEMLKLGVISQEEYDSAVAEELHFQSEIYQQKRESHQSYYVDQVIADVINDLVEKKGYTKDHAENLVYSAGYRIYTPMNVDINNTVQSYFENTKNFPTVKGDEQPQSAMLIMDFEGHVVGMAGGIGEKTVDRGFNRACQMVRQNGSTMKPIGAYGPGIEFDKITYSTLIEDSPHSEQKDDEGNLRPWPQNYYGYYKGNLTVQKALELSTNTVAVKVCDLVTPKRSFDFVSGRLGVSSLVSSKKAANGKIYSDIGLPQMALGSLTDGISPKDLAAAYQTFGNGGKYYKPSTYTKVVDSQGNVILENNAQPLQAFSPETATIMNKLLQRVVTGPEGTGKSCAFGNWEIAAKTGTTSDYKDFWYVGMTPYYVGVVWYGYDTPKVMPSKGQPTIGIWKNVMSQIHKNLPDKKFELSSNVVEKQYCTQTGKIANGNCPHTLTGYYKPNNIPDVCTAH